jgi:ribosomal protein L15
MKLRVLSAVDYAPGDSIRERIKSVSQRRFRDETSGRDYRFTWRTIETWLYRFKKHGITAMDQKTRSDKNTYRKIQLNELAEAINDIDPSLRFNKTSVIPKMALYRKLLEQNYFSRSQLSQTSIYRMLRENDLLNLKQTQKLRQSFAMQFANELWQADTMYGPSIKQANG